MQGQPLDSIFLVTNGVVELINNKGMVCRTFANGSFFGEKCAFFHNSLSRVSFRAKTDVELFTISRDCILSLLNTYDDFARSFVDACKKREEHRENKKDGSSKFTSFKKQNDMMFRPCTPPSGMGRAWNQSTNQNSYFKFEAIYNDQDESLEGLIGGVKSAISDQIKDVMDEISDLKSELSAIKLSQI